MVNGLNPGVSVVCLVWSLQDYSYPDNHTRPAVTASTCLESDSLDEIHSKIIQETKWQGRSFVSNTNAYTCL